MSQNSWSNYWKGREGQSTGALTGVESDKALQAFWAETLIGGAIGKPLLDLACGAGTVLKKAANLGYRDLTGLDYSAEAIAVLKSDMPAVKTVTGSASDTGLDAGDYTTITSQFGLEYAGAAAAFNEASRVAAPDARIIAIMHMAGGGIEAEVKSHAEHCQAILDSKFKKKRNKKKEKIKSTKMKKKQKNNKKSMKKRKKNREKVKKYKNL